MLISILRQPDSVTGATEKNVYRFEERPNECNVQYEYILENRSAKIVIYPNEDPIKYIKLRFRGDFSGVDKIYGDDWARCSYAHPLTWQSIRPERCLPWFCYVSTGKKLYCYGVKTGADCFASWYVDSKGITLFLDLSNGSGGTFLKEPLTACEVVESEGREDETTFETAKRFAGYMCDKPVLPNEPVFGVNNWYWAYGDISAESVLQETDYLMLMTNGTKHRPYMIIDDGWQKHRTVNAEGGDYIGGEWQPNDKFGDMKKLADKIHDKGAKAGLWFRPLLTREKFSEECILTDGIGGNILDPSHPEVLKKAEKDACRIRAWGYELIKHDFTQMDMFGSFNDSIEINDNLNIYSKRRVFYDKTKTNATIIKNLYKSIAKGAGDAEVIGCNVFGHLSAGIHSVHRIGGDTSGRNFEITRSDGVNSMMRLPLNKAFYLADPDCAAFTQMVNHEQNLDFMEMCAITGVATIASVAPDILTKKELKRINTIFKMADENKYEYGIHAYDKTSCPDTFIGRDGEKKTFDWYKSYDGIRIKFEWVEK